MKLRRSLVLHCKMLAPGRVKGWSRLLAAAGGRDIIPERPMRKVKNTNTVKCSCVCEAM